MNQGVVFLGQSEGKHFMINITEIPSLESLFNQATIGITCAVTLGLLMRKLSFTFFFFFKAMPTVLVFLKGESTAFLPSSSVSSLLSLVINNETNQQSNICLALKDTYGIQRFKAKMQHEGTLYH